MKIERRAAHPALRPVLRSFSQRRASLTAEQVIVPLPARPDQFIEFFLGDPYRIRWDEGAAPFSPGEVVVGPQSRSGLSLVMAGEIDVFTIRFHPTGLHRLTGVPMPEIVDEGIDLVDLLGPPGRRLRDMVLCAPDFAARADATERWVAERLVEAAAATTVDRAAGVLARTHGVVPVMALAARTGLSVRQFERRFREAVGLTPKFYARTTRLARALDLKVTRPDLGWAEIADIAGYSDQPHLVRDCTALAGAPPARFVARSVE